MTKRIVSGIFILTALGALGVILAGALTSGEQLIVRFLTAVIVAALGLYVISDLRLQADEDAAGAGRAQAAARLGTVDAPPNSTAAFMATVTRRSEGPSEVSAIDSSQSDETLAPESDSEQQLVNAGAASSSMSEPSSATVEDAESGPSSPVSEARGAKTAKPRGPRRPGRKVPAPATVRAQLFGKDAGPTGDAEKGDDKTGDDTSHVSDSTDDTKASESAEEAVLDLRDDIDVESSTKAAQNVANGEPDSNTDSTVGSAGFDDEDAAVIDLHEATVDLDSLELPNPQTLVAVGGPATPATATLNGSSLNGSGSNGSGSNGNGLNGSTAVAPRPTSPSGPDTAGVGGNGASFTGGGPGRDRSGPGNQDGSGKDAKSPMFEYSDELQSPDYDWPAPSVGGNADHNVETSPFERASQAYEAEKQRLAQQVEGRADDTESKNGSGDDNTDVTETNGSHLTAAVDQPTSQPTSLVARGSQAAAYAAEPSTPVIDLRAADGQSPTAIDAAINAGEVEVISTLIEQGMLSTDGPISDRDVRTMVYVAFTSNELRKLLTAGGTPEGPNHGLELGPVELFDERVHAPAPKRLYSGMPKPNQIG